MVAEILQSTTICIAIASLEFYPAVATLASVKFKEEVRQLTATRNKIDSWPYTGCVSPVPVKFSDTTQPLLCT